MASFCGSDEDAFSVSGGVLRNICFVDILNIIPHAILILICGFILIVWNRSFMGRIEVSTWVHFPGHRFRWVFTLIVIALLVVQIAEGFFSDIFDGGKTSHHAFLPNCIALIAVISSIIFYHNLEQWNSPKFLLVLLIYWLACVFLKILKTLSLHENGLKLEHLRLWLTWIDVALSSVMLLIELNGLRIQRYAFFKRGYPVKPSADLASTRYIQSHVNFLSQATYWWMNGLLIEGYKHPLDMDDLGNLPHSESASTQANKLQKAFEEEKLKASEENRELSLHRVYLRASWKILALAAVYRVIGDLLAFVGPWCIEHLINFAYNSSFPTMAPPINGQNFVVNPNTTNAANATYSVTTMPGNVTNTFDNGYVTVNDFFSNGYVLCALLFVSTLLQHTFLQNHHYLMIREGIRMRTALQTLIYTKALRFSSLVMNSGKMTVGQIMNHMSMDTMHIMFLFFFVHFIWACPLQALVALILMYFKLGLSALIGGLLVSLCAPIQYYIGNGMSRMQKKVMLQSDKRVKKCNEMIHGVKVIKLLAWENYFSKSITTSRKQEMKYLYFSSIFRSMFSFSGTAIPALGTMVTFIIHPYIEDEPLTAGKALSTLALFNVIMMPVVLFALFITTFITANVSCKRLVPYFQAEEVEGMDIKGVKKHVSSKSDTVDGRMSKKGSFADTEGIHGHGRKSCISLRRDEDLYSSQSSLESSISHTPCHSRQNSQASLLNIIEMNKWSSLSRPSSTGVLTVGDAKGESGRHRHTSGFSTEDEDELMEAANALQQHRNVIEIHGGDFSWDLEKKEICLSDINIKVPIGKLTMIVGPVGAGKSSLLSAMFGEMLKIKGKVEWHRGTKIAYVSQKPWLLNASLKDNITFGHPYSWRRYRKIINACALQPDLAMLPAGDMTEIGEKGVNLSGGQKQRVSIARALYSKSDTVIMDDPLSALDAHVGKHVFDNAIMKRLLRRKRTVILITHQLQYLVQAAHVIAMRNCVIQCQGPLAEIKKNDPELYESWRKALKDSKSETKRQDSETSAEPTIEKPEGSERAVSNGQIPVHDLPNWTADVHKQTSLNVSSSPTLSRQMSNLSNMVEETCKEDKEIPEENDDLDKDEEKKDEQSGKLIKKEHRETGAVSLRVYLSYAKSCGIFHVILVFLFLLTSHGLLVSSNYFLSVWSEDSTDFLKAKAQDPSRYNETFDNTPYMKTYVILNMSGILVTLVSGLFLFYTGIKAAKTLHYNMLKTILHVPLRFFDTNPTGRIINRFSADIGQIDQKLPATYDQLFKCIFTTLSALIINIIGTWYFLFAAIPILILYFCIQHFFRTTARELQRLDSTSKSPIFSHFSETLNGLQTIRAYGVEERFRQLAMKAINTNVTPFLFIHTINRWLGIRLDYMGAVIVLVASTASLNACINGHTVPAFVGLSVSYALLVSLYMNWVVRNMAEAEMLMNAVERIDEYTKLETEPDKTSKGHHHAPMDSKWPEKGEIEFKNVSLKYDDDLDPVVIDANCVINPGEKIGVCGRTGSGKSSMTLSLFRMINISEGDIIIDKKSTSQISLHDLRSKLAIIPQDPVLFTGTVRYNLDPSGELDDDVIWEALQTVQLKETIADLSEGLDSQVSESGENFSVGQRQLFCLARAFLRENKILVLDEATASIDLETDNKLQQVISTVFKDKTVITIAHRLSTIMKYDRVMVMSQGRIVEFNSPKELLKDANSHFSTLVNSVKK